MKKNCFVLIVYILAVLMLMTLTFTTADFAVAAPMNIEETSSITTTNSGLVGGCTLIAETGINGDDRVIIVDNAGTIVWQYAPSFWIVTDAERLSSGNILISDFINGCVFEVDNAGTIVWQKTGLDMPYDAERLANGNTLIAETTITGDDRVIEVNNAGTIVWQKTGLSSPQDAERLANGNTLITERTYTGDGRIIEVNNAGTIVWQKSGLDKPYDAERLANGNTLIAETTITGDDRVIEVNNAGTIVWQKTGLYNPLDVERLANGNTLIADTNNNRVIEVNNAGTIVWQYASGVWWRSPVDAERLTNLPPNAPTITGPNGGEPGTQYTFTFNAVDPDGDDVRYIINWGDLTSDTTSFNPSGAVVTVSHTWMIQGTYTITAYAEDTNGLIGPETSKSITMPRNKAITSSLVLKLLEQLPLINLLLQRLTLSL